mgnify:FL=1
MRISGPRAGSIALVAAAMTLGACTGTGAGGDTTSTMPTTQVTAPPTTPLPPTSTETTQPPEPLPTNSQDYAAAAFEAWVAGDEAQLGRLLTPEASTQLDEINADPAADWEFTRCEGAAGSSYCEWLGPDGTLTFCVGNEAASAGEEHAVSEVIVAGG